MQFSSEEYKKKALNACKISHKSNYSVEDAFFLLINGQEKKNLSNLIRIIKNFYAKTTDGIKKEIILDEDECYKLTQGKNIDGKIEFNKKSKRIIYDLAYYCLLNGKPLGDARTPDGKFNTSDWIGHSLLEGKVAGQLAKILNADSDTAIKHGILHDYGRSIYQDGRHVIKGFELLIDKGWEGEAIGCLTHSFLAGGRCSYNDRAKEGFFVDDDGNAHWKEGIKKDDLTLFLENYPYTKYDLILNVADLMATSYAIVSPQERVDDIAKRRTLDKTNRGFFLSEFTNTLVLFTKKMGGEIPTELKEPVKAAKGVTLEEINNKFHIASNAFYEKYQELYQEENREVKIIPSKYGLKIVVPENQKDDDFEI